MLLDEAYWGFLGTDNHDLRDLLARFPNLLVVRTFSKLFALPGIRAGNGVAGDGLKGFVEAAAVYLGHNRIAESLATAALDEIVDSRRHQVEGDDREHGEKPLDERLPALPLCRGCCAVDPVQ